MCAYAIGSYRVPKEVGKVGTESATFIEPIEKRKDGIEAMFAKQKSNADAGDSPPKKPGLRPESAKKKSSPTKTVDSVQAATNRKGNMPKASTLERNVNKEAAALTNKRKHASEREVIEIEDSSDDEPETPLKKVSQLDLPYACFVY